eukprot:COSAG06_NODE_17_length_34906_cov_31.908268_46_plen_257_part_00
MGQKTSPTPLRSSSMPRKLSCMATRTKERRPRAKKSLIRNWLSEECTSTYKMASGKRYNVGESPDDEFLSYSRKEWLQIEEKDSDDLDWTAACNKGWILPSEFGAGFSAMQTQARCTVCSNPTNVDLAGQNNPLSSWLSEPPPSLEEDSVCLECPNGVAKPTWSWKINQFQKHERRPGHVAAMKRDLPKLLKAAAEDLEEAAAAAVAMGVMQWDDEMKALHEENLICIAYADNCNDFRSLRFCLILTLTFLCYHYC